jgi:GLPGLI family protein
MKNIYLLTFIVTSLLCLGQSPRQSANADLKVLYRLDYTKYVGSDKTASENQVLIVKEDGASYFMFQTMLALDSIQKIRPLDVADIMLYKSPLYYVIKRKAENVTHFESLGNDLLKYDEQVTFNWKLINENKMISGYNCKKATVEFEGRKWIAWYANDIPVNAGPYKFYGLPGLILGLSDTDNLFIFNVNSVETGNFKVNNTTSNYFLTDGDETVQEIRKVNFHKLRNKFYQMSMDEKLKYMNRGEDRVYSNQVTTLNGEKVNTNRKPKTKHFIERYD